jgi:hypothetical protein
MGLFGNKDNGGDQGRTSAEGGNGNVRDTRAEHNHVATVTPHVQAVRDLHTGSAGYEGKHRA